MTNRSSLNFQVSRDLNIVFCTTGLGSSVLMVPGCCTIKVLKTDFLGAGDVAQLGEYFLACIEPWV